MDYSKTEGPEAWLRRISAKGVVGAQIAAHDWSASPLGSPTDWPQSMRIVVDLVLESPLAMFVAWGPEAALVCNDALVECLGEKLLDVTGLPWNQAWSALGPDFGPLAAPVLSGQITCLKDVPILRRCNGKDELQNFTFKFSPVPDGENRRAGVFCIVRKTTERVEAKKRACITEALRDETRVLEILNKTGALLASTLDLKTLLQSITDAGTQLSGARFGAFFYNGRNAQGEAMLLYTLSGAPIEAFHKFGVPRPTTLFSPTFHGGAPIRSADITKDPRYGKSGPHFGMPAGHPPVRSYLALPVISRSGEVLGGLFFGHPEAGVFTECSERVVSGVVAQAAMAIDNARLYEQAQKAAEERKALLASERSARAEAERLSRTKDEFLAMLAHELRNPLAPISSSADVLNMLFANEPRVRQTSAVIMRQVGHMTRLIDDLLDVSRVTRGLIKLELKALDFRSIVSGALDQTRPMMDTKSHRVVQRIPVEPIWVDGDQTRLIQATANIFNNAAKYTRPGGLIEIELSVDAGWLQLRVRDNGSGMPPELVPTVFDLFTQGARTLARSQGGLGLGLTLVRRLVELHGGTVVAHSDGPDQGSEFTVSLRTTAAPAVLTASRPPGSEAPPAKRLTTALRVLIIDDNVDAADSLGILLSAQGYSIAVEYCGEKGLQRAAAEAPDVLLIDIGLPDIDGYSLAQRLRVHPRTARALLIAVTGYGQSRDREQALACGFSHHLVKPVDMPALAHALATLSP